MNVRSVPAQPRRALNSTPPKPKKSFKSRLRLFSVLITAVAVVWGAFYIVGMTKVSADVPINEIRSAVLGYCLDDYANNVKPNAPVYAGCR